MPSSNRRLMYVLLVVFVPAVSMAQTTSTLLGVVRDASVLPGASITVKHLATNATRTIVTEGDGNFLIPFLPVGEYEVTGELSGFQNAVRRIALEVERDLNNFAPRLGFAYQPFGNGRTVLSGGYGVFYSEPMTYMGWSAGSTLRQGVTVTANPTIPNITLANAFLEALRVESRNVTVIYEQQLSTLQPESELGEADGGGNGGRHPGGPSSHSARRSASVVSSAAGDSR